MPLTFVSIISILCVHFTVIDHSYWVDHVPSIKGHTLPSSVFYLIVSRPAGAPHLVRCLAGSCDKGTCLPLTLFPTYGMILLAPRDNNTVRLRHLKQSLALDGCRSTLMTQQHSTHVVCVSSLEFRQ